MISLDRVRSQGVELEAAYRFNEHLRISNSFGYTDTKIQETVLTTALGKKVPGTPNYTNNLGVDFTHALFNGINLISRLEWNQIGPMWFDVYNSPGTGREALSLVNARLGVERGDRALWSVTAWANNLTNKFYNVYAAPVPPIANFSYRAEPRMYGVDVTYSSRSRTKKFEEAACLDSRFLGGAFLIFGLLSPQAPAVAVAAAAINPADYPALDHKELGHIRRFVRLSHLLPGDWSGMSDDLYAVAEKNQQFQLASWPQHWRSSSTSTPPRIAKLYLANNRCADSENDLAGYLGILVEVEPAKVLRNRIRTHQTSPPAGSIRSRVTTTCSKPTCCRQALYTRCCIETANTTNPRVFTFEYVAGTWATVQSRSVTRCRTSPRSFTRIRRQRLRGSPV